MSEETFKVVHLYIRKLGHLTEYGVLGFLALRAAQGEPALRTGGLRRQAGAALIFCALYAATDEFHQRFVPDRQASVADVLIDTCGAASGIVVTLAARRLRRSA